MDKISAGEAILRLMVKCLQYRVEPRLGFVEIENGEVRCHPRALDECHIHKNFLMPIEEGMSAETTLEIVDTSTDCFQRGLVIFDLRRRELLFLLPCREMANPGLMREAVRQLGLDLLPIGFARRRKDGKIRRIPRLFVLFRLRRLRPDINIYVR